MLIANSIQRTVFPSRTLSVDPCNGLKQDTMSIQVLWELPYGEAIAPGLEERIVSEIPDNRNI